MLKHNIIIGGGIAGLVSAALLAEEGYKNIVLIEANDQLGGLLRSFEYEGVGKFDYGTHYMSDCYGDRINALFSKLFLEGEWSVHPGINSDVSGLYFNGKFNNKTVFPDLTSFSEAKYKEYRSSYIDHISNLSEEDFVRVKFDSAQHYLQNKFGELIANEVFGPTLEKIFGKSCDLLHPFAAHLVPMNRVILFNKAITAELLYTRKINSGIAFPDQLSIPEEFQATTVSHYPIQRGINSIVSQLESYLIKSGVSILKSSRISDIGITNRRIDSLVVNDERFDVNRAVSTIPLIQLAKMLNVFDGIPDADPPKHTVITNLMFDKNYVCDLNKRHYFYCYDTDKTIFRITNYNSLTLAGENPIPLTVESLHESIESDIGLDILNQLKEMGIVSGDPVFIKTEPLNYGFPLMTIRNMNFLKGLRRDIVNLKLENLTRAGALSEDGVFFMRDVLVDLAGKIEALKK